MTQTDELLTVEQAAERLGVTVGWLYQLRGAGAGPMSWKQRGRLVYPQSQLELYRARQREASVRGGNL